MLNKEIEKKLKKCQIGGFSKKSEFSHKICSQPWNILWRVIFEFLPSRVDQCTVETWPKQKTGNIP